MTKDTFYFLPDIRDTSNIETPEPIIAAIVRGARKREAAQAVEMERKRRAREEAEAIRLEKLAQIEYTADKWLPGLVEEAVENGTNTVELRWDDKENQLREFECDLVTLHLTERYQSRYINVDRKSVAKPMGAATTYVDTVILHISIPHPLPEET